MGRSDKSDCSRRWAATWEATVTLRLATTSDASALARLAELDSRSLPPAPHLVAEREDRMDAALSLRSGEVVADPFRRTAELCELLRHHAETLPACRDQAGGRLVLISRETPSLRAVRPAP